MSFCIPGELLRKHSGTLRELRECQRIAKGAGGKGPRQKKSKKRQKVSKSFSTLFDNFRAGQKKRQKSSKSVKNIFDTFRRFSRGTIFPAPFGELREWQASESCIFGAKQIHMRLILVVADTDTAVLCSFKGGCIAAQIVLDIVFIS